MLCATLAVLAFLHTTPALADGEPAQWTVRMRRVEGAAVDARRAAEALQETAQKINNSGNLGHLPALRTQLEALDRWVVSARMAVDVAKQDSIDRN